MGQHKHNPTAIAKKEGKLPPKKPKWAEDELYKAMPEDLRKKVAMLTGTLAALDCSLPQYNGGWNDV